MDLTTTPGYVPGFLDTFNLRDLGGIQARDGRRVRHGLLYRGSTLAGLDDAQRMLVDAFGLRFILDLRARGEAAEAEDYVPEGTAYLRVGGMRMADGSEVDFSPSGIGKMRDKIQTVGENFMLDLYTSMVFDNPAVHELVTHFAAQDAPLYFHCSAGKDRTGVCAAVLLVALGVPDEAIIADFLLTNEYRASIMRNVPAQLPPWVPDADTWAKINGVDEAAMQAVFAAIDQRYKTREAYLAEEFGLDATRLAELRDYYLV